MHIRPENLPQVADPPDVLFDGLAANFKFHTLEARGFITESFCGEFFWEVILKVIEAGGVDRDPVPHTAAKQLRN